MRILLSHFGIYKKSGWGRTYEEAKGLVRLGHEVTLLCSLPGFLRIKKSFKTDGVRIVAFFDIIPKQYLAAGYGFISLFSRLFFSLLHPFDIALSNSHRDNAYYPCALNRCVYNSKLVIEWWDNFRVKQEKIHSKSLWVRALMNRDAKREIETKLSADRVVTLSSETAERAIESGVSEDRIIIIRGGCDIDHIHNGYSSFKVKSDFGITTNCLTFGFIGDGDSELEDIGIFLDAMLELKAKYNLLFLNYGVPIKKSLIKKPELKEIVHNCGWIDYYGDNSVLLATDVFVLIKQDNVENRSGWPNKLGDYLACGRPVILNPYGELVPFIQEWHPGFITVDYSKECIKECIVSIYDGKYDLPQLGKRNRDIACLNSWQHRAEELDALFTRAIGKNECDERR